MNYINLTHQLVITTSHNNQYTCSNSACNKVALSEFKKDVIIQEITSFSIRSIIPNIVAIATFIYN